MNHDFAGDAPAESLSAPPIDAFAALVGSEYGKLRYSVEEDTKSVEGSLVFLVVAIILCVIVIVSIDNTIRLAMFSNRFLIKTMQMVGATRGFIAKPLNIKAIINGAISGLLASALLFVIIFIAERSVKELKAIHDTGSLILLFLLLILAGVGITLFSTHRSVIKYLRMKLDDLY